MKFRAVCFDIDGTMYPNASMYLRSVPLFLANWRLFLGLNKARKILRTRRPVEDFHAEQAALVARILDREEGQVRADIDRVVYRLWSQTLRGIRLYRGFEELLPLLRQAGLKIGVLSDFPVEGKLDLLGIAFKPDASLSSESLGYLKPNPEGFLRLAADLGLAPAEILYVGNSRSCDVAGAKAAGMSAAWLTRRGDPKAGADLIFNSYEVLGDFVLKNT